MNHDELQRFAMRQSYLTIDSKGFCLVFSSLREIENKLDIDHSTISKNLKMNPKGIILTSRLTHKYYFIRKVDNSLEDYDNMQSNLLQKQE